MTAEEELAYDRIIAFSQSNGNGQLIEILQIPDCCSDALCPFALVVVFGES